MKTRISLLAGLVLSTAAAVWNGSSEAGPDAIVVIVNTQNPIRSVDVADLRPIFQTTKTHWGNSAGDTLPLNLPEDNPTRQEFDKAVLGLDPDRVARYWQDRKIRGGARPPSRLSSSGAMLRGVAAKPGAVGYVRASEVNATVKVVGKIADGKVSAP
jgi:ABC-type phosphate transport system substrate-binding protein